MINDGQDLLKELENSLDPTSLYFQEINSLINGMQFNFDKYTLECIDKDNLCSFSLDDELVYEIGRMSRVNTKTSFIMLDSNLDS